MIRWPRAGEQQADGLVVERFTGRRELGVTRIGAPQKLIGVVGLVEVTQAHGLGVEGNSRRGRQQVAVDGFLRATEGVFEDTE